MKKFLLPFAVLPIMMAASCNKTAQQAEPVGAATMHHNTFKTIASKNAVRVKGKPCSRSRTLDCSVLDEVVCHPKHLDDLTTAISLGKVSVGQIWSSTAFADVASKMDPAILTDLQSGQYNMMEDYRSSTEVVYLVGTADVLTADNMEYALQMSLHP